MTADFELVTDRLVVRGFGRDPEELCGGTLASLDATANSLAELYAVSDGIVGPYNWYAPEVWSMEEPQLCGSGAACVHELDGERTLFSRTIPFEHEMVHLVRGAAFPRCLWILEEGLAEFLGGTSPAPSGVLEDAELDHTLAASFDGGPIGPSDYQRARHFTSFLVDEYGIDTIIDLCNAVPAGTTRLQFDEVLVDSLGVAFAELEVTYSDYPECRPEANRAKLLECARPVELIAEPGTIVDQAIVVSCAQPESRGPLEDDGFAITRKIRISADGYYSISLTDDPSHPVDPLVLAAVTKVIEQCASCGDGAIGYRWSWPSAPEWYVAGDYVLDLQFPKGFVGDVTLHLQGMVP